MDDVVAVVTDLFFRVRIVSAARYAGRKVRFLSGSEGSEGHVLALVDLDAEQDVLSAIRQLKTGTLAPVVAFGPHVDAEGRRAARAAGADRVLAKSRFVTELPVILQRRPSD